MSTKGKIILLVVGMMLFWLFLLRGIIFRSKGEEARREMEYQAKLETAQQKLDKFNKNVLPNMAFKGIIESIEYSRDTGDHYWASVKLTKTLKMGKIPKEYKYIYTIENNKIIKI